MVRVEGADLVPPSAADHERGGVDVGVFGYRLDRLIGALGGELGGDVLLPGPEQRFVGANRVRSSRVNHRASIGSIPPGVAVFSVRQA